MENFLTAAKLHVHAKRFMDAYSAAMQPLSREFAIPQTAAEILLFLANNPGKPHRKGHLHHAGSSSPALSRCTSTRSSRWGFSSAKASPATGVSFIWNRPRRHRASSRADGRCRSVLPRRLRQGLSPEELSCFARCMETISQNLERAATGTE